MPADRHRQPRGVLVASMPRMEVPPSLPLALGH